MYFIYFELGYFEYPKSVSLRLDFTPLTQSLITKLTGKHQMVLKDNVTIGFIYFYSSDSLIFSMKVFPIMQTRFTVSDFLFLLVLFEEKPLKTQIYMYLKCCDISC